MILNLSKYSEINYNYICVQTTLKKKNKKIQWFLNSFTK